MKAGDTTLSERIGELVELSGIYFSDGAPRTAAKKLREAADLLDAEAARRDGFLAGETA